MISFILLLIYKYHLIYYVFKDIMFVYAILLKLDNINLHNKLIYNKFFFFF